MDADNTARKRLAVLQLAEQLGSASEACRRLGVDRTSFYQWKGRFARDGLDGLRNRQPVHGRHPQTTPADVAQQIAALALASPAHGCDRIAKSLAKRGVDVSAVTIQKILHKSGLGTHKARAVALEARYAAGGSRLSVEQIKFLETLNPCFRERQQESAGPGAVLWAGAFFLGRFDGIGPVYVHAVVDSFSSYAFGVVAATTGIEVTLAVLRDQALPFFLKRRRSVACVGTKKVGMANAKMVADYLTSEGVKHKVPVDERANGFLERFRRTAIEEFLRQPSLRRAPRFGVTRLQREFESWLAVYNHQRPQEGYRNYGAIPSSLVGDRL